MSKPTGIGTTLPALVVLSIFGTAEATVYDESCIGDRDLNRAVTIEELVGMVSLALQNECVTSANSFFPNADPNCSGFVDIDELIVALNNALYFGEEFIYDPELATFIFNKCQPGGQTTSGIQPAIYHDCSYPIGHTCFMTGGGVGDLPEPTIDELSFQVSSGSGTPGSALTISIAVASSGADPAGVGLDLRWPGIALALVGSPDSACVLDPGLPDHSLLATSLTAIPSSVYDEGVRLLISPKVQEPIAVFSSGSVVSCAFQIEPASPLGLAGVVANRLSASDVQGVAPVELGSVPGTIAVTDGSCGLLGIEVVPWLGSILLWRRRGARRVARPGPEGAQPTESTPGFC